MEASNSQSGHLLSLLIFTWTALRWRANSMALSVEKSHFPHRMCFLLLLISSIFSSFFHEMVFFPPNSVVYRKCGLTSVVSVSVDSQNLKSGKFEFQVRQRAVKTIVRAFCPNLKTVTQYSLAKLTYLLGFEDVQGFGFRRDSRQFDHHIYKAVEKRTSLAIFWLLYS